MASSRDHLRSDTLPSLSTARTSPPSLSSPPRPALLRDALSIESLSQTKPDLPGPDNVLPIHVSESVQEAALSLPYSTLQQFRKSTSRRSKKALSTDCIPRQTILKALASRATIITNNTDMSGSVSSMLANKSAQTSPPSENRPRRGSNDSPQNISTALSNFQLSGYLDRSPAAARLILQSPCYFHQRFDDAVNIKKVLEEIADDEWLSHSRLVQTATGVREVSKQLQRRPIKRAPGALDPGSCGVATFDRKIRK
ncbi:hypothetical protein DTO012A8_10059 [Penicillium roqueforti]|nr:hypothetical protein DTO012A8_10059 [Penicillium roqueforti]